MIDVRQLSKRYGATVAVDRLSFSAPPGCVTGFLGPNGAGKSTVLRVLLGLDRATAGAATIGGQEYAALREPLRRVGAVLDASAVHPGRSAWQHLWWVAQTHAIPRARAESALAEVGLSDVARKRVGGFSLGMKQRLGLAVALLGDPEVLVLDEPTNGLDPAGMVWIRQWLRSLAAEGRTVLVSSHVISEVSVTADRLVIIDRGRLAAETSVRALTSGGTSLEAAYLAMTSTGAGGTGGL